MRWKGRRQSEHVEDISSRSGGGIGGFPGGGMRLPGGGGMRRAGTPSIGMLIIIVVVCWFLGINPLTLISGGGLDGTLSPSGGEIGQSFDEARPPQSGTEPELQQFVRFVLAETEDTWTRVFREAGETYTLPEVKIFRGSASTACGFASAASGPFYCPGDRNVYIDLAFYDELRRQFKAPGDFAQAYVIAHEVGHHVQNLIGVLPEFNRLRREMNEIEANAMSVRVELQADCFAGIWAKDVHSRDILEQGDLDEGLNAAAQIGDDAIQKRTQGYVVPESFNHGTSEQRKRWFMRGFEQGTLEACNTFDAEQL